MKEHPRLAWLTIAVLLVAGLTYLIARSTELPLLLAYLAAINVVTYLLYRYDKLISAHEGITRIPNRILALLAIAGGSVGALGGIYLKILPGSTHKTEGEYWWLRTVVWLSLLAHGALLYCVFLDKSGRCQELWRGLWERLKAGLASQ
jgi:uncharacterized membrane protein YsdA (DUF1294 family)